jgi:CelD/BcsL family acetyltransferase involved in cellulose biosynthesis
MTAALLRQVAQPASIRPRELRADLRPATNLDAIDNDWRDLFDQAIEANPFYGPDLLRPLIDCLVGPARIRLLTVHAGIGVDAKLLGLLPLERSVVPRPWPLACLRAFRHPLVTGSMPLIDAEMADDVWRAILDRLAAESRGRPLVIDNVILDQGGWTSLQRVSRETGRPVAFLEQHRRAAIIADRSSERYWREEFDKRDRQSIARRERRLSERGNWRIGPTLGPAEFEAALADFMRLELAGWKGRNGTAFAARPDTAAFAARAFSHAASHPAVRIDTLDLDRRCLAAAVALLGPHGAASMKAAYDETEAALAPGQLLDVGLLRSVLDERWTPRLDSVALPGHPLERLWKGRVPVATVMVGLRPGMRDAELARHVAAHKAQRAAREAAKAVYHRLTGRGWRPPRPPTVSVRRWPPCSD